MWDPIATCSEDRSGSAITNLGHNITEDFCLRLSSGNGAVSVSSALEQKDSSSVLVVALGLCTALISLLLMASLSTTSLSFKAPSIQSTTTRIYQVTLKRVLRKASSFQSISFGRFQSSKRLRLQISCAAKPETVQKVSDIVKEQLALSADTALTAESKFSALGADSLDTVEIVMALEEKFDISVEETDAQNITTIQEAADLIEDLVQKKPAA
ncbi:acyl carrier protein 4, chloroplastic-like isoform X1 [Brassica napus]|uniref:acyl carrier protein 4, chloroplastic-like isoform X1 n=1 Tax=Brassica napus TaxID=3708 RepID=UPI0020785AE4|nr:acyl carrier protein 4, chloroplastic-like isoform X1 [Brassica napus]